MWQDYVFSIGGAFFVLALIPSILSPDKPSLKTSIPTAMILYTFTATYLTLHLWLAALSTCGSALCWTILAVQKARTKKINQK